MTLIRLRRCRVLKRIPKASRIQAADKLAQTLRQFITDPGCIDKWLDLMTFAYSCFAIPSQRGGQRHLSNLASKVNRAIARQKREDILDVTALHAAFATN